MIRFLLQLYIKKTAFVVKTRLIFRVVSPCLYYFHGQTVCKEEKLPETNVKFPRQLTFSSRSWKFEMEYARVKKSQLYFIGSVMSVFHLVLFTSVNVTLWI